MISIGNRVTLLAMGVGLITMLASCEPEPKTIAAAPMASGENALRAARQLVDIGPRASGTEGARRAAEWILHAARERGYDNARIDTWQEDTVAGTVTFRNVVALREGDPGRRIIVGSHYDTKLLPEIPAFAGANDSASSTGLLLEIMRLLANADVPENCTVEFMFFDGEESRFRYGPRDGLHGSRRAARQIEERDAVGSYLAMILLDMVGDADLRVTLPMDTNRELAAAIFKIADRQGVREAFGYYPHGSILDDHYPFMKLGIPSVDIIDFNYGPDNSYWHTAEDTVDKLSADSLQTVGNVALELLWRIAAGEVLTQ